MSGHASIDRY